MSASGHYTAFRNQVPSGIILLGLTPAIMVLLPWDFGPDSTVYRTFMRGNLLTTTVAEFLFVLLAMSRGFSPAAAFASLPALAKAGLAMLTLSAVWTTIFVAASQTVAIVGMIKFFAHLMFALAIAHQLNVWTSRQRELIWPAVGLGIVSFCLLWGINIAVYHPKGDDWIRLAPTLTTMRSAGPYALACFCAGIGMLYGNADNNARRLNLVIGIFFGSLGVALAAWTGTRAGIIAIIIAAILATCVLPVRRQLLILTLASMVIGLAVAAALPLVHPAYGIERMFGVTVDPVAKAGVSSGRFAIWMDMFDKIGRRPIMGWGIDQFRFSFPVGTDGVRHPHNGIMQLVFSTGLWGVSATLMIAMAFLKSIPAKISQPSQFASVAYAFGICAYGVYDGPFYFTYPVMILMVAGACIIAPMAPQSASDRSG
jgi:O-antigen ligase